VILTRRTALAGLGAQALILPQFAVSSMVTRSGPRFPVTSAGDFNPGSPSFLPVLPWAAGPGAASAGGSGTDAVSGGSAAAQAVYLCGSVAELRTACNATGRRWAIIYKSGIYNIGTGVTDSDGEVEIRNDGLITIVDLSPSPGAIIKGGAFPIWNSSRAGLATRGKDIAFLNIRCLDKGRLFPGNGFAVGTQENASIYERLFFGYSNFMYSYDQIMTLLGRTSDCGIFGCIVGKAIANSVHPESPHSTGIIVEWLDDCDDFGVIRSIMSDNAWRNPITGAVHALISDCLAHNFQLGTQIAQANDEFTSGYPTFTTVEGCLFIRGAQGSGAQVVSVSPNPEDQLHAGSRICLRDNKGIGYPDTTQAELAYNPQGWTLESSPVPGTPFKGYIYTPFANRTARAALMASHCGAWPAARDSAAQAVLDGIAVSVASPGRGGSIIDAGSEIYPSSLSVNTADFTTGPDPAPGITSMTTGGFSLGASGRVITGSGHSEFQQWVFRRLSSVAGIHA
jgi:hypothetical protein